MRIALITLHRETNFGSVLQAYALKRVLQSYGHVELLDYTRPTHAGLRGFLRQVRSERGRWWSAKMVNAAIRAVEFAVAERRGFGEFFDMLCGISPQRFVGVDALRRDPPKADVYVTGSDQVWNPEYNQGIERAFYLDFGPASIGRISFGASFGVEVLPPDQVEPTRQLLRNYAALGIREPSGVALAEALGLSASRVLDPTLLLGLAEWSELTDGAWEEAYVLIYSVEEERGDQLGAAARSLADELGCAVWQVTANSGRYHRADQVDRLFSYSSPRQFLALFRNATYVVTSSFHGTVFSVVFERPFVSIAPPRYGERAKSLLELLGIENRYIEGSELPVKEVDWLAVRVVLEREQARSVSFLSSALAHASSRS
ncbi:MULTISPECIES: polysaccharide pyruvyl transferase family protein [unclassified Agromyces]|uniref:polysaccharide pyruvyl transferase family protein n=1 Tax=unclassified Agromyces TaxID=2639701 RepID=UPI0030148874